MHFVLTAIKDHWKLSLFVLAFLPILTFLGLWQLDRAAQKRALLTVYQQQQDLPALPFNDVLSSSAEDKAYRNISVVGSYDQSRYWLIDNRSRGGVAGYEVIMPLQNEAMTILINRGWVAASASRQQLPAITTPSDKILLTGYLYAGEENALVRHSLSDLDVEWPKRVLQLDADAAAATLKQSVYPMMLRISDNSPGALTTHWPVINTQPEKHQGYAVQWFSMAIALIALYIWFLIKGNKHYE